MQANHQLLINIHMYIRLSYYILSLSALTRHSHNGATEQGLSLRHLHHLTQGHNDDGSRLVCGPFHFSFILKYFVLMRVKA